jgi:transposase
MRACETGQQATKVDHAPALVKEFAHRRTHGGRTVATSLNCQEGNIEKRHLVECLINKIQHFRRIFSHFVKIARRYVGFIQLASVLIWLR